MQGQLLSQITGSLSGGLPVAASRVPGRKPYWNEVPSHRLLATSDIWVCVTLCVYAQCLAWRVGACVSAQRPNCLRSPATCFLLFYPCQSSSILRLGPVSHLPIHLKAENAYWDPIWGWGRGARVGPQQGWKTQQQHDEAKEEVESEGKRWRMPGPPTGDGFKWLPGSLSSSHLIIPKCLSPSLCFVPFLLYFSVFSSLMLCSLSSPRWCWEWDVQLAWPCCWLEADVARPCVCGCVCVCACKKVCE